MPLELFYITNNPKIALIAEKTGVNRVMIDLETLGKEERQKNMNSVKSHHTVADVVSVSECLTTAEVMVRINPWNPDSHSEIEAVISAGAQRIMLPMWKTVAEAAAFLTTVHNRVHTTLLLETKEAVEILDEVLGLQYLDEIHIGLNDLHLSYGLTFMFEVLSNGLVEKLGRKCLEKGVPYGFGGIARLGEGLLPAERVIMEHYRLGSTRAILSRSFCNAEQVGDLSEIERVFSENMVRLRAYEATLNSVSEATLTENQRIAYSCIEEIAKKMKGSGR